MKRFILFNIFVLFVVLVQAQKENYITQNAAWDIVKENILKELNGINVYASSSVLAPNKAIATWNGEEITPSYESWFFFIDDMPFCNWTHPCRYVYVDTREGKVTIMSKRHPPLNIEMKPLIQNTIKNTHRLSTFPKQNSHSRKQSGTRSLHQYAVIISGGGCMYSNWERYWNDCSAIYQVLINVYGYSKQNIYVLMADGTNPNIDRHMNDGTYESSPLDLDGDGLADIQYDATRSSITSVFNTLSNILTEEDDLFIFTTDHGDRIDGNHVVMCLWNGEIFHDYEFASYLNNLSPKQINICMEQCYSGGFIDNISRNNVVISTACRYDEESHARQDLLYDEYVYHWISAVAGETPSGVLVDADNNNDGHVSMIEAFEYANYNDATYESPQYNSTPSLLGDITNLMGTYLFSITGSDKLYSSSIFGVQNLPTGYMVSWSLTGSNASNYILQSDSLSTNQCTITQKEYTDFSGSGHLELTAQILRNDSVVTTLTKEIIAVYISGPTVPCASNDYSVDNLPNGYTVEWSLAQNTNLVIDDIPMTIYGLDPDTNQCTIIKNFGAYAKGKLIATLKDNDVVKATLIKALDSGANLSGTWSQGLTSDVLLSGHTYFIQDGSTVFLQSDDFIGASVSYSSTMNLIGGVTHNNNVISFRPRSIVLYSSSESDLESLTQVNNSIVLDVTKNGTCEAYQFTFRIRDFIPVIEFNGILDISHTSNEYCFTINWGEDSADAGSPASDSRWQLEIFNFDNGLSVYKTQTNESFLSVNTTGWKPGVYIATANIDEKTYSTKIYIK